MIEFEFKVKIHKEQRTEAARVTTNIRIIEPRNIFSISRRACKNVMYKPQWRGVFGTDLDAIAYRYRAAEVSYKVLDKHYMVRNEKMGKWSEWYSMDEINELLGRDV